MPGWGGSSAHTGLCPNYTDSVIGRLTTSTKHEMEDQLPNLPCWHCWRRGTRVLPPDPAVCRRSASYLGYWHHCAGNWSTATCFFGLRWWNGRSVLHSTSLKPQRFGGIGGNCHFPIGIWSRVGTAEGFSVLLVSPFPHAMTRSNTFFLELFLSEPVGSSKLTASTVSCAGYMKQ